MRGLRPPFGMSWPVTVLLALTAVLSGLTSIVVRTPRFDGEAAGVLHAPATADYDWAVSVTDLTSAPVVAILLAVVMVALMLRGRRPEALALVASAFLSEIVAQLLKHAIARARPPGALVEASGFSYPSGHASLSMAVYATLGFLAARWVRGAARIAVLVAAAVVVVAVGWSRVFLGAHYPSDVVAGWLVGAGSAVTAGCLAVRATRRAESEMRSPAHPQECGLQSLRRQR